MCKSAIYYRKTVPSVWLALLAHLVGKQSEPTQSTGDSVTGDLCASLDFQPQIWEIFLDAHAAGVLHDNQIHIATACRILHREFARIGIIGLIDEATGYQEQRAKTALATILEKFIAKELQPWTKTFPYEFYQGIFRLKGWPGPDGVKRPVIIAQYTNDFVYNRLAPGVFEELKRLNPRLP